MYLPNMTISAMMGVRWLTRHLPLLAVLLVGLYVTNTSLCIRISFDIPVL